MANSKIKGITIKFGADTTALSKALKSAEDTSKSLGSELSSVNKLLKFDPKNTQLLAQKQELLSKYDPEAGRAEKFRRDVFPSVKFPVMVPEEPSVKTPAFAMPSVPPFMFRTAALERLTLANRVAAFTFMPEEPLTARALL